MEYKYKPVHGFSAIFYCSVVILALVGSATILYANMLQMRYKSEKFRCETPFFHKRDETGNETANVGFSSNQGSAN